jgi:preprotein translocase subunit SecD
VLDNPGRVDIVRRAIGQRARIDFRIVDNDAPFMLELATKASGVVKTQTEQWETGSGSFQLDTYLAATDREALETFLDDLGHRDERFVPPANREFGFGEVPGGWRTYYLEREVRIGSRSITDAKLDRDASVTVALDDQGARDFEQLTSANVGNKLAIVLDGRVITAPIISGTLRGGHFTITLGDTAVAHDARALQEFLKTGALPVRLLLLREGEMK